MQAMPPASSSSSEDAKGSFDPSESMVEANITFGATSPPGVVIEDQPHGVDANHYQKLQKTQF